MRAVIRVAFAFLLSASPLLLITSADVQARERPPQRIDTSALASPQLIEQGTYVNRQGKTIPRPAHTDNGQVPSGASASAGTPHSA